MKKRVSILADDMETCYVCGSTRNVQIHEVYHGSRRKTSIRYGCVVPLCVECHLGDHGVHGKYGGLINRSLKEEFQVAFEKKYPDLDFIEIFGKNYR